MATLYNSKHRSWTTLNNGGSLSSGGTSVTVLSAASLPAAPFVATIEPGVTGQEEVVAVTGVTSNTLTLVRGLDGTTGVSHPDGCLIKNLSSSLAWSDLISLFKSHTHAGDGNTSLLPDYYAPKNAVVNGSFSVWQRGTSFAAIANATFLADMWKMSIISTAVMTASQQNFGSFGGIFAPYGANIAVTTADTSVAATDTVSLYTVIEGYDIRPLTNGMTLSFWVKAHRTGTYCVSLQNSGVDRSYVAEYTIAVADVWQYVTLVIPAPPTTGTWNYTTGKGLYIEFVLMSGSTYQTTPNAWNTGNFICTSNQVNGVGATTDVFSLAMVNLIPGSIPQPLIIPPYALELARCQRYCYRFAPGASGTYGPSFSDSTTTAQGFLFLPTTMLATPTGTFSAASTFWHYQLGGTFTPTGIAVAIARPDLVRVSMTGMTGLTNGISGLFMDGGAGTSSILLESNP